MSPKDDGAKEGVRTPLEDVINSSEFESGLNRSQLEAFRSCLRQELALIQGPPGTGKSFVGKAVLSFLVDNRSLWRKGRGYGGGGPLLVVCYTNQE